MTTPGGPTTYSYRPSVLGATWAFKLEAQAIFWDTGRKSGRIPLRSIRRVRLSFKPLGTQTMRYRAEIWSDAAPKVELVSTSWKSMVEQERLDRTYRVFVQELHRQLSQVNEKASFDKGVGALPYWCGIAVCIATLFAVAALVARAMLAGAWQGAAIIVAFAALFLWQAGRYFRRNAPGRYRPDALPADLIPPA